jgi:putative transposase
VPPHGATLDDPAIHPTETTHIHIAEKVRLGFSALTPAPASLPVSMLLVEGHLLQSMSIMPTQRRHRRNYNEPGHAHELTFTCQGRHKFLQAERSCEWLRDSLQEARRSLDFDLWAFVFMPEHVHLIVHPRQPQYDISVIREAIKEPVGRKGIAYLRKNAPEWLPKIATNKGQRVRHRFWLPGGGYDRNIDEPRTLLKMIDYIHMNPVRRGLVVRSIDWKWSSALWHEQGFGGPIPIDPIPPEWLAEN